MPLALFFLRIAVTIWDPLWIQAALVAQNPPSNTGDIRDTGSPLCEEDPLEEGKATPSSILVWRIPWTEEPGELQSMGSQRVGHD